MEATSHKGAVPCNGFMINTNTYEKFRQTLSNPESFLTTLGKDLLESMKNGSALHEPWRLLTFIVFSYSDLKKYRFHYWPAHPTPYNLPEMHYVKQQVFISEEFTADQVQSFEEGFLKLNDKQRCFFSVIVSKESKILEVVSLSRGVEIGNCSDKEVFLL